MFFLYHLFFYPKNKYFKKNLIPTTVESNLKKKDRKCLKKSLQHIVQVKATKHHMLKPEITSCPTVVYPENVQ